MTHVQYEYVRCMVVCILDLVPVVEPHICHTAVRESIAPFRHSSAGIARYVTHTDIQQPPRTYSVASHDTLRCGGGGGRERARRIAY
jgi:hypothetical protein